MKIRFKESKLLNKNNFEEVLLKALNNLDNYEMSDFKFIREWQLAYIKFIEEVADSIIKGLALNLNVSDIVINKSLLFPSLPLLKASNDIISEEALLYKSLWQKLKEQFTKPINIFKKFFFNNGKDLEPMKIDGQVIYNPETKKDLTKEEWKNIENGIVKFMKDTLGNPDEEIAIRAGLFGLLKKKMDDEKISVSDQQNMTYDDIVNKFGEEINDSKKVKNKWLTGEYKKNALEYAKKHGAEHLSIKNETIKNKMVKMFREQIVGGLEDGLTAQQMISRLYWIDPSDELGKRFNNETIEIYNRDLRRIVITEMSYNENNGYLAAYQDDAKKNEKQYFVFAGHHNPQEKPNESCNKFLGKIGLLTNKPKGSDYTDDSLADYLVWVGKNNVGRKESDYWFCIPLHPHCTHFWERINPTTEQWNSDINKIELKTDEIEKSQEISIDNIEWKKEKYKPIKEQLPDLIKKVKAELKIDFPIIVRLYKEHEEGKSVRSMHDEGIIIIYENSPDWKGDLLHEVGHLYYHIMQIEKNKKILNHLNSIKSKLEKEKQFNRIFGNEHTYSNIKEIFATIFKWYISGKVIDKMYLMVIKQWLPDSLNFLNDIFNGNLKKSFEIENTIAFDFDKVIAEYEKWEGETKFGKPIKSTIDLMAEYKKQGFKIIIFTTRSDNEAIRKYLKDNNVIYDKFIGNKPFYNCFVDDKTVNNIIHKKNLKQIIDHVLSFNKDLRKSELKDFDLLKNDKTKLKMEYKGIPINIEWLKGEVRSYPGSPYKNPMIRHHYGYIRNTNTPDGEDLDVYVHIPIIKNAPIYMLNQLHANDEFNGEFDEHKFMIGYPSKKAAKEAYIETMQKNMFGGMTKLSVKNFKENILPFYKK